VFRIKYEEILSYKLNADTSHLLDSLVSALAVYATAFRSKLSLWKSKKKTVEIQHNIVEIQHISFVEMQGKISYYKVRVSGG